MIKVVVFLRERKLGAGQDTALVRRSPLALYVNFEYATVGLLVPLLTVVMLLQSLLLTVLPGPQEPVGL